MWKERKRKKIFGSSVNYGFKLIISLLVVSFLGLSPLLALPWRSVNRLSLTMDSNSMKNSPGNSLKNSEEVKMKQEMELEQAKPVLKDVDSSLANILIELSGVEDDLEHQKKLVKILESDNFKINQTLIKQNSENSDLIIENLKLNKEAYGTKLITKVTGTYNRIEGFGVGGSLGLKFGKGLILEGGAIVPLSIMANPPELMDYKNYTFEASLGWEW